MTTRLLQLGLLSLTIGVSAFAQTYTNIMSGENSQSFSFLSGTGSRTTVTSIQSPFGYPNTITGANDSQTYSSGSTGGNPEPWWFYYASCGSNICAYDLTGTAIPRPPSIGQISSQKSSALGFLTKATLNGTVSNGGSTDPADMYETFYFTERDDYAGQREIGIARQMSPYATVIDPSNPGDYTYAYWYTNDNCGVYTGSNSDPNMGYPNCRTSQATGGVEVPATAWGNGQLLATGYSIDFITGLTIGTQYIFQTYIFYANWDSTYKQRIEVWDSTFTTQIFADNIDTTYLGVSLGLTTSGTSGYVTLGTERYDPSGTLSQTGINLSVNYVQIITP